MPFISYAQNFEDIMLWRALKSIPNGFYIDVGANDPTLDSVTRAFYERGWHGINIEPVFEYFNRLCSARKLDINLNVAISNQDGELVFYEIPETGLSTMDKEASLSAHSKGWQITERRIPAHTLNEILSIHAHGPIHFLKIDVEGAEKLVLEGCDFSIWRPWILVIEATIPLSTNQNYDTWEDLVLRGGYTNVYFDGVNRFYVANEHADLKQHFTTPPNYFDDFVSDDFARAQQELSEIRAELEHIIGSSTITPGNSNPNTIWVRLTKQLLKNSIKQLIKKTLVAISGISILKKVLLVITSRFFPQYNERLSNLFDNARKVDFSTDFLNEDPKSLSPEAEKAYSELISAMQKESNKD